MKTSNLYLKTLLTSFTVLLAAMLYFLYMMQTNTSLLPNLHAAEMHNGSSSQVRFQELKREVIRLETLISETKAQTESKKDTHEQQIDQFIEKLSELQMNLANSKTIEQKILEQLQLEKSRVEQLTNRLDRETLIRLDKETMLALKETEVQSLDKNLANEQQRLQVLQQDIQNDTIRMTGLLDELGQNKSDLVKSQQALAASKQALRAKSRELMISESHANGIIFRNESLNLQISALGN